MCEGNVLWVLLKQCCVWLRLQRSGFLVPSAMFLPKMVSEFGNLESSSIFFSLVVLLFALLLLEPVWGGKCCHMASSLVCESVGKACGSHLDLLSSGLCWIELERGAPLSSAQGRRGIRMEDVTACLMGNSCFCMEAWPSAQTQCRCSGMGLDSCSPFSQGLCGV